MTSKPIRALVLGFALLGALSAQANNRLAPGFEQLPAGATVVVMPLDVELFNMSAGGVVEPQAEWTVKANGHMKKALVEHFTKTKRTAFHLADEGIPEITDLNQLHSVLAGAIAWHHVYGLKLPTKDGKLDWSMGDAVAPIAKAALAANKTEAGAPAATPPTHALFVYVRDSYASAERKAMMIGMAILGVGIQGGSQIGYASLVDLSTGRVVWFNHIARASGDLREAEPAVASIEVLMQDLIKP